MSNSVVRVRENSIENSLLLVIGEDGHIIPDKETVQEYLKNRNETELKIMQVNKSDGQVVDITVDQMTYIADQQEEVMFVKSKKELEQIAKSLYSFRLDHDYTPFIHSPPPPDLPEIDELDHTLSLLEGNSDIDSSPPELVPIKVDRPLKLTSEIIPTLPSTEFNKPVSPKPIITKSPSVLEPIQTTPKTLPSKIKPPTEPSKPEILKRVEPLKPVELPKITETPKRGHAKVITSLKPILPPKHSIPKPIKSKNSSKYETEEDQDEEADEDMEEEEVDEEEEEDEEDDDEEGDDIDPNEDEQYTDDDFTVESEESMDDANDSDYEIEEKPKARTRAPKKSRSKSQSEPIQMPKPVNIAPAKQKVEEIVAPKVEESQPQSAPPEVHTEKPPDKKVPAKREKKPPKPLPNDFMLFATPDIIRRVGGKQESTTPSTPPASVETFHNNKPVKNSQDAVHKSEHASTEIKVKRQSVEKPHNKASDDNKTKDRRSSNKLKQHNTVDIKSVKPSSGRKRSSSKGSANTSSNQKEKFSAKDIRAIIQNENTRSYTTDLVIPDTTTNTVSTTKPDDEEDLNLSIDNIDEILYKVAETLADDKEFQNALDKSLDENMVLNTSISSESLSSSYNDSSQYTQASTANSHTRGTHVVRAGGRVVVIPPAERPTTRSRNKVKHEAAENPKTSRPPTKVINNEHVSGGELDSSSDDDRSDDDPEKLWCICNQPHNNRFMICCDSCEEWYHGKCVNVTKQMGQMMEREGREWICIYCKDLSLKRPAAAARRVRKLSRNSGTDRYDSNSENTVTTTTAPQKVQGCIVCGKACRNHSIFCSDACIVQNAKDVEKVVVFERSTGKLLSGTEAPTAANLDKWLKKHPGFEVVRSKTNVAKQPPVVPKAQGPKLQVIKDPIHQGVSLALQKRGVHVGLLKHSPKEPVETTQPPVVTKVQQPQPKPQPKVTVEPKPIKKISQVKVTQPSQMVLNPAPIQSSKKRKSVQKSTSIESQHTPKEKTKQKTSKSKPHVETPISSEKKEEGIRDSVRKSLGEQLTQRIQTQNEIKLDKEEVIKITNEIESQLYRCFGDTGQKYRNKYRSLMFNIKDGKNQTLWRSIYQRNVNPYQLVRLSPDELANQELASWRERENKHQLDMITKTELDQLGRTPQYVIKTHKGEQEVEDNRVNSGIDKTEMVTGLTAENGVSPQPVTTDKKVKDKDKKHTRSDRDKKHDSKSSRSREKNDKKDHRRDSRRSSVRDRKEKRRSRSRSKGSSRHVERHRSKSRDRHRRSHKSSTRQEKKSPPHSTTTDKLDKKSKEILETLVDNKIVPPLEDKLWKHVPQEDITTAPLAESDSDHEPTSTVTIPTPPHASENDDLNVSVSTSSITAKDDQDSSFYMEDEGLSPLSKSSDVIWSGIINMIDVAEITITAHEVSGDCVGLGEELPPCLDVVGRIPPETVWEYIGKMKLSNSKAIAVIRLTSTSVEAQMPYIALYSYLQSRNRLGVVKIYNKAVKDFYILPLASHMPIPPALLSLGGTSFEDTRPVLLLGIIVRDKRKRPLYVNDTSTPIPGKRVKIEKPLTPPIVHTSGRSYTPPPAPELQFNSVPPVVKQLIPESTSKEPEEDPDEPYSPKDSDPDTVTTASENESKTSTRLSSSDLSNIISGPAKSSTFLKTSIVEPFNNKFDAISGLHPNPVLFGKQQLQLEMELLDQQIAKQRTEIQNMSQNIASTSGSHVGGTLSNIELPKNIQQILDSIKTPQSTNPVDGNPSTSTSSELTIPLMLPKINARNSSSSTSPSIPLNLPRYKNKGSSDNNSPSSFTSTDAPFDAYNKRTTEQRSGVLSSLSDDELIRKANEMMKTVEEFSKPISSNYKPKFAGSSSTYNAEAQHTSTVRNTTSIRLESSQPPIPGLD